MKENIFGKSCIRDTPAEMIEPNKNILESD